MTSPLRIENSENADRDLFVEVTRLEVVGEIELAQRFLQSVWHTLNLIRNSPGIGRVVRRRKGNKPEIRRLPVSGAFKRQLVYYSVSGDVLRVERVLNGSRSVADIFP